MAGAGEAGPEVWGKVDAAFDGSLASLGDVLAQCRSTETHLRDRLSQLGLQHEASAAVRSGGGGGGGGGEERGRALGVGAQLRSEVLALQHADRDLQQRLETRSHDQPTQAVDAGLGQQLQSLRLLQAYLAHAARVQGLSTQLAACMAGEGEGEAVEKAIALYTRLLGVVEDLRPTACLGLLRFARDTARHWHARLTGTLTEQFREVLAEMGWPETSGFGDLEHTGLSTRFKTLFLKLLRFQAPDATPEPIALLAEGIIARFQFHFQGERETAALAHPEWAFTYMLEAIAKHDEFLVTRVNPLFLEAESALHAKDEFTLVLARACRRRVECDLIKIRGDLAQLRHHVREMLRFDESLHTLHGLPLDRPGCAAVLYDDPALVQDWLRLEKAYAQRLLRLSLAAPDAWDWAYPDICRQDQYRLPKCADQLLNLVGSYTTLGELTSSAALQWELFAALQQPILDDLRDSIQLLQEDRPLSIRDAAEAGVLSALANTCSYLALVLSDWSDATYFIQLHAEAVDKGLCTTTATGGTLFDEHRRAFFDVEEQLVAQILKETAREVEQHLAPYAAATWQRAGFYVAEDPDPSPLLAGCLSFCDQTFARLRTNLAQAVWAQLEPLLASTVANLWVSLVVLRQDFDQPGAAQLAADLNLGLLPLLKRRCGAEVATAELQTAVESARLLTLPDSEWSRLHGLLRTPSLHADAAKALLALGVRRVGCDNALAVLNRRADLVARFT